MGRGGGGEGAGRGREWGGRSKTLQVKTRGHQSPSDGPDQPTRLKGHHSGRGKNSRLVTPNWHAPQVPMCRSWFYKVVNPPPRKADPLSLAMGDMLCK